MWIIIAYKPNELNILKNSIKNILKKNINYYIPKIKYKKLAINGIKEVQKNILQSYLICNHDRFIDQNFLQILSYAKGVKYILNNSQFNQKDIINFINNCKNNEDKDGFLKQSFFEMFETNKLKFMSGPFSEMIFEIIENNNKKIRLLKNNLNITVSKNQGNPLYSYI